MGVGSSCFSLLSWDGFGLVRKVVRKVGYLDPERKAGDRFTLRTVHSPHRMRTASGDARLPPGLLVGAVIHTSGVSPGPPQNPQADALATRADDFVRSAPLGGSSKRTLDLMIAATALVLALPAMIVIATMIGLTSGDSPVFSHERVGHRGRLFPCYKFRTMVRDADVALASHLARDPVAAGEWAKRRKLRNDPRVTSLGWFLRKCSLDELPQLFNVLRGDMSCVGPRPVTLEELERYGAMADDYLSARPGITGLWQVAGRSSTDFATRVAIDKRYVRGWSLLGDVAILARTPAAVLRITQVH